MTRDPLDDIYSPENIARSRARAAWIRRRVGSGELADPDGEWLRAADGIEEGAAQREAQADTR